MSLSWEQTSYLGAGLFSFGSEIGEQSDGGCDLCAQAAWAPVLALLLPQASF